MARLIKQLVSPAPGVIEVAETPMPTVGAQDILVQMEYCGVCGTDVTKVYSDQVSRPVSLGHELVGTVLETGREVRKFSPGQRVALAHHAPDFSSHYTRRGSAPMDPHFRQSNIEPSGFAEVIRVPGALVPYVVEPIPDAMSDLRALFMEPLACCLRALDRISVVEGDTVLIVGVGAIGLLFVPLLRDRSVNVLAADVRAERIEEARQWGARAALWVGEDDVIGGVRQYSDGIGADVVILTVIAPQTWALALSAVRDGGTILLFGAKPGTALDVDVWQVWRREINVISSYSSTPDLLPRALAILRRPEYTLEATISHVLPLDEGPRGFQLVHEGTASKVVIARERH